MSSSGRKRASKWDLKEESHHSLEDIRDNDWPGKSGMHYHEKESEPGWFSPEGNARNGHKWSVLEANDKLKSMHDLRLLSREPLPRSRGSRKSDGINEDYVKNLKSTTEWDGGGSYSTKMSPGLDEWRQLNHHHSPKSDWHRSHRSRSRSQSRSPVHGIRRQSGFYDRSKSRSGVSTQICKDFAAGRCRRGNTCPFLHQGDQSYEDCWDSRNRKGRDSKYSREHLMRNGRSAEVCSDFLKGNCRRGASCRYVHDGASDGVVRGPVNEVIRERENERRDRGGSLEQGSGRESRRSVDIPCKFFAAGNCRNGKYCRFSHNGEARVSPDRWLHDDRRGWGHNSNDVEKLWNGPKSSGVDELEAAKSGEDKKGRMETSELRFSSWSVDDGLGHSFNENGTHGCPALNLKAVDSNEKEALQWKTESAGVSAAISESKGTDKWLGDMEMSPEWNYGVKSSNNAVKEELGHISQSSQSLSLNNASLTTLEHDITKDASGWTHDAAATLQPAVAETSYFLQDHSLGQGGAIAFSCTNKNSIEKSVSSWLDLNFSANIIPAQSFDQNVQISSALPYSSLKAVGQSQLAIPTDPSTGLSLKSPENDALFQEKNSINKLDTRDSITSQVNSATMVSSEQLTQLTNLSASLAQLLGNGQQLPQLYAALNHQNAMQVPSFTNSEGPVEPDSSVTIQPNQAIALQKQYDPICDSIEPKEHDSSASPHGFPVNPVGQKNFAVGKPEIPHKKLMSSTFVRPNGDDYHKTGSSEEEPTHESRFLNQQEPGTNSEVSKESIGVRAEEINKVQEEKKIAQENGPLENIGGDGKADDIKKSKDLKGIRAFKFSLVELVKELLKPAWKEGQMSKEAYKNIVKKVVDKVTGTMQGANIPQTQEKIDQYLSVSKPKLTKLIQAYVEKIQKS